MVWAEGEEFPLERRWRGSFVPLRRKSGEKGSAGVVSWQVEGGGLGEQVWKSCRQEGEKGAEPGIQALTLQGSPLGPGPPPPS